MRKLNADIILWPVWCDYNAGAWNDCIEHGYAGQAALCGDHVLLVNPFCADSCKADCVAGGAVYFKSGAIAEERLLGPVVF